MIYDQQRHRERSSPPRKIPPGSFLRERPSLEPGPAAREDPQHTSPGSGSSAGHNYVYNSSAAAAAAMAFNPFLLHRPADYSVSSLLAAQHPHYVPGLLPHHPGLTASILPKLQQTVRSPFMGDVLLPPQPMRPVRSLEPPDDQVQDDPKVELDCKDLWEQFHNFGTEMVITKSGR